VAGYNTNYLWLLARETDISDEIRKAFIDRARALGFGVDDLVWLH
jgi:apolipoprotein D and lipocalin family protein